MNKVRHLSEETKRKIGEANKGKKHSEESNQRNREKHLGKHHTEETKKKISLIVKGRKQTEETKRKISESKKGKKRSPETCRKMSEGMKGRIAWNKGLTKETHPSLKIVSERATGRVFSEEHCRNISKSMKGIPNWSKGLTKEDHEGIRKRAEAQKGRTSTLKGIKHSEERKIKAARALFKAVSHGPNKTERFIQNFLQKICPNEYKYVGNGKFILGSRCPDFLNINGKKKLIEYYGHYWHRGENIQKRIDFFKKYGFDTLIIWEYELKDIPKLSQRIIEFTNPLDPEPTGK